MDNSISQERVGTKVSTQDCCYLCFYLIILLCIPSDSLMTLTLCKRFYLLIWDRETERERDRQTDRQTSICCSTYLCLYWLILVCALTRDQTHNLGVSRQCSNQLSYPARAELFLHDLPTSHSTPTAESRESKWCHD